MKQIPNNEWQTPMHRGYIAECCQCGLKHEWDFRIKGRDVQFRVRRIASRKRKVTL